MQAERVGGYMTRQWSGPLPSDAVAAVRARDLSEPDPTLMDATSVHEGTREQVEVCEAPLAVAKAPS